MIEIKDLTMVYNGKAVLDNVELELAQGQIVGLVGENGSGKSTLLRILAGLERTYEGEVLINGANPGGATNQYVSYQPDHLTIDESMKIEKVVALYEKFYEDFSADKFYKLLDGFAIDPSIRLKECSKGMKEKVQIALTLARKTQIYLLDEPISGVDPKSRKAVLNTIIENFDYEGIMLVSTHLVAEIEKVLDRVLVLEDGRLKANETVDNIRLNHQMGVEEYFTEVL